VWLLYERTFRWNVVFFHSVRRFVITVSVILARQFCHPDDGGYTFLRNFGSYNIHVFKKTSFFVVTAVKTSALAKKRSFYMEIFSLKKRNDAQEQRAVPY
jgi:hypothetical protein